jgi:hypothetical protein
MPQNKGELIERMRQARAALEHTISSLSNEELIRPGADGGWSVKDHLAHLAAWARKVLAIMQGRPAYEGLQVDEMTYRETDLDGLNAILYEHARNRSLADVLADFRQTHRDMLIAVEGLSEADLAKPYVPDDPTDSRRLVDGIISNSYEHDLEHQGWIEELLTR